MLPPLGTSRRITRCGSRRQSPRRRTCHGGPRGVELRAGLTLGPWTRRAPVTQRCRRGTRLARLGEILPR